MAEVEKIVLKEFNKLSVEARSKIALNNFAKGYLHVKGEGSLTPFLECWAYSEKMGYITFSQGSPSAGAMYKMTLKGLDFIQKL